MTYFVYALYSPSIDKIYIGQTKDLSARIKAHSSGYSKYTSVTSDWKLFYYEEQPTRSEAMRRERQLKTSRGRAFLRNLIGTSNQ